MTGPEPPLVGIVDYGMGNRRSVEKALQHVGARTVLTGDHTMLERADAIVVPGVGAFPRGMANLRASGLDGLICSRAAAGTPVLGICLGMQLLFDGSTELGDTEGLGLIPGRVIGLESHGQRVPHIGWNEVRFERASPLTAGIETGGAFYHVHSFAAHPAEPAHTLATAEYGERFTTIAARDSVYGVQFHPEKSSRDGLALLGAFAGLTAARNRDRQAA